MSSTTVVANTATWRAWCLACNRCAFDQWSVVMRGGGGVVGVVGSFGGVLAVRAGAGRGFGDATAGSFSARGGGGAAGFGLRSPRPLGGVAAAGGVGGDALAGFAAFRGERFFRFFAARNL